MISDLGPTSYQDLRQTMTRSAVRAAVRAGRLASPLRGVYSAPSRLTSTADLVRSAQLSIRRDLPAGFHSAAALHGFGVVEDGRIHLVGAEAQDHAPRPNLFVHSSAVEPKLVLRDGILTTTGARAAVDLARVLPAPDGMAVLDACLRSGVSAADLANEMERHAGLRGVVQARSLMLYADALAESPQESRIRLLVVAAGLPLPRCQIPVPDASGQTRYRLDLGWESLRIGVEYDGAHHTDREFLRRDRERQNWLVGQQWRVLYFTDIDVYRRPLQTVERIRSELRAAARVLGLPDPSPTLRPIKEIWPLFRGR
ncbi:MAG TPA: DUF559 domain-containing protein [Jatrophihabitans sp.]